jgi:hypothetical protein
MADTDQFVSKSYDQPDKVYDRPVTYTPIIGTPPADKVETNVVKTVKGRYEGVRLAHFTTRKERGDLLPLTPYLRYDYEQTADPGDYLGTYKYPPSGTTTKMYNYNTSPSRHVFGTCSSEATAHSVIDAMLDGFDPTALVQEAFADCAPDFDALTTLVEANKTIAMVLGARRNAQRLIREAMRGGFSTARAAARAWLEWRYGWRILGYDIQNFCEFYNYPVRDDILEGRARTSFSDLVTKTTTDYNYYVNYDRVTSISRSLDVNAQARVKMWGNSLNLLTSPVNTAWEVIPFSFVADWFVSVGDVLKAWTVLVYAQETTSSWGWNFEESGHMYVTNPVIGTGAYATSPFSASGSADSKCTLKRRIPLGSPSLFPRIRLRMGAKNVIDAAALLSGVRIDHLRR